MRERKYLVQAFYYGPEGSIELWLQRYFSNYDEALYNVKFLFAKYDQVTISKIK